MKFIYNDGGRSQHYKAWYAGDCVTRAIAIATGQDYKAVYDSLNDLRDNMRQTKQVRTSSARDGVARIIYQCYLESLGWKWIPCMTIGSGCVIHLREGQLPQDKTLIVRLSKHMTCIINNVIHDTYDPSRDSTRCVYGYFIKDVDTI